MRAAAPGAGEDSSSSLDAWQEVLSRTFVPLETTPLGDRSEFAGRVQAHAVADLQLSVVSGTRQVVRRTSRWCAPAKQHSPHHRYGTSKSTKSVPGRRGQPRPPTTPTTSCCAPTATQRTK